jgi:hypothetical protein
MSDGFYVYIIAFDNECFGIFATRKAAEESLAEQISKGGPAWGDCKVEQWAILGEPERMRA